MSRPVGRLNLTGAMNRKMPHNQLAPISTDSSNKQASVSRLERELKTLKEENESLKEQLEDTSSALKQLTNEASSENFDERRVNLLKLQLIQLQRQVLLMSEALASRSTALMEAENALTWLSETFRRYIGADVKGAEVPVLRSELITMVETSESARIKLFKNIENCSRENLARPHMFMNEFLKPGDGQDYTVLDSCLGHTDCLNLKHVAQLESKLSTLYKELIKVSESLEVKAAGKQDSSHLNTSILSSHMASTARERVHTLVLRAGAMARDCAADLLPLSLLYPSAPWPPLKKPTMTEVTYEALAPALPTLPRSKAVEIQQCVTAALKACNHHCHMLSQEALALREEVRFHQAVYELQLTYVQQVFTALRDGYCDFEKSTNEVIIQPMKKLLAAYNKLKNISSEESLREFLLLVKENAEQWKDIVEKLEVGNPEDSSGSLAFSEFGKEFMASVNRLVATRQKERDQAAANKRELKEAQQQLEEELRTLIRDAAEQKKIAKELSASTASDGQQSWKDSSRDPPVDFFVGVKNKTPERADTMSGIQSSVADSKPHKANFLKKKALQRSAESERPDSQADAKSSKQRQGERKVLESMQGLPGSRASQVNPALTRAPFATGTEESEVSNLQLPRSSSNPEFAGSAHLGKDGLSQDAASSQQKESADKLSHRPPSSSSSAKQKQSAPAAVKPKNRPKPRNYEPKLYVANRTLSLRRSGSLTKLSEPTMEEKFRSMSASSQSDSNAPDGKEERS